MRIARRRALLVGVSLGLVSAGPGGTARAASGTDDAFELPAHLSLDGALAVFRAHGLDLLVAEAAVHSAEGDVTIAGQVANPNLSYNYTRIFHYDPALVCPPDSPGGYGGSDACSPDIHSLTLGDNAAVLDALSGKRGLRLAVARAALASATGSRDDVRRNLEFQVKAQFLQVVLARDQLAFAAEVQADWQQTLSLGELRYRKGAISERDEAVIETAKLEADQALAQARQALAAAKAALAYLLGARGAVPEFEPEGPLPPFAVPSRLAGSTVAALLKDALEGRPDLKAQQAQVERAAAALRQARRARVPDVGLQIGFSYAAPAGGAFSSNTVPPTLSVGLGGNLPVLYQQQGEIRKAEADLASQSAQLAKVRAQVVSDVATAWSAFVAGRELVERMRDRLLERARTARDLTQLQYQKGAASLLEYLDAERAFIAAKGESLQDLAGYWTAVFQLEQAVGADLR